MKSISFLMPNGVSNPVGGVKVVFEYANRFVSEGYSVYIVMPVSLLRYSEQSTRIKMRILLKYVYYILKNKYRPYNWFELDKRVKLKIVWNLDEKRVPKTDIYVATYVRTSDYLAKYNIAHENKFYFIQHFEDWAVSASQVYNSYKLNLRKIVIAKWLKDRVEKAGANASIVKNGFDFSEFKTTIPVEKKNKFSVTMLYHLNLIKGCKDGLLALNIVKEKYPEFKAILFGVPDKPKNLPSWIEYYQKPSKRKLIELYNQSAIFIGTSHYEGWGLTLGEAMICSAAVACTDNEGYAEMVKHADTALISPIKDPVALAENIIKLIEDDKLRYEIARSGNTYIQQFTWDKAYNEFKTILDYK